MSEHSAGRARIQACASRPYPSSGPQLALPAKPQTVQDWRQLLFQQIRLDWRWVEAEDTWIDLDTIEEIIRRIAAYGVLEEPDEGGSGPNEEVPRNAGEDLPSGGLNVCCS